MFFPSLDLAFASALPKKHGCKKAETSKRTACPYARKPFCFFLQNVNKRLHFYQRFALRARSREVLSLGARGLRLMSAKHLCRGSLPPPPCGPCAGKRGLSVAFSQIHHVSKGVFICNITMPESVTNCYIFIVTFCYNKVKRFVKIKKS